MLKILRINNHKMKKIKLLFLALFLGFVGQEAMAQDSAYVNNEYAKAMALYNRAQRYNDVTVSKQALLEMTFYDVLDEYKMPPHKISLQQNYRHHVHN